MEKLTLKVTHQQKTDAIKCHEMFSWKLEKEEKLEPNIYQIDFVREDVPNLDRIKILEKQFFRTSSIPLWLLIVIPAIAIIYITVMFILIQTKTIKASELVKSIIISIPTAVLLVISMGLTYFRNKQTTKYIAHHDERVLEYEAKVKALGDGK